MTNTRVVGNRRLDTLATLAIFSWIALSVAAVIPDIGAAAAKLCTLLALLALIVFCLAHGAARWGWSMTLTFIGIILLVANIYENLSITTGFPFGHYVHNPVMGPRIFLVPIAVSLGYIAGGYAAWAVAECIVGPCRGPDDLGWTLFTPIIASLVLVGWDICQDPLGSTLRGGWTYRNPGGYFGVPLSNFLGWALVGWTMFQLCALILARAGYSPASRRQGLQAAFLWGAMALQLPLLMVTELPSVIHDRTGWAWRSSDILQAGTVTGLFLMLPTAIIAGVLVLRRASSLSPVAD